MSVEPSNPPNTLAARPSKLVLVAWALGECGGDREFVDNVDVTMYAFRAYPGYFGFQKYPEHPDVSAVRLQLYDLLKLKNSRLFALDTETPIAEKSRDSGITGFRLSSAGVVWWKTNRDWISHWVARNASSELGTSKSKAGRVSTEDEAKRAIVNRVRSTPGFAAWMSNPHVSRREIGLQTLFTAFGISPRASRAEYIEARDRVISYTGHDAEVSSFLKLLDQKFGEEYRKILTGEVEI